MNAFFASSSESFSDAGTESEEPTPQDAPAQAAAAAAGERTWQQVLVNEGKRRRQECAAKGYLRRRPPDQDGKVSWAAEAMPGWGAGDQWAIPSHRWDSGAVLDSTGSERCTVHMSKSELRSLQLAAKQAGEAARRAGALD